MLVSVIRCDDVRKGVGIGRGCGNVGKNNGVGVDKVNAVNRVDRMIVIELTT